MGQGSALTSHCAPPQRAVTAPAAPQRSQWHDIGFVQLAPSTGGSAGHGGGASVPASAAGALVEAQAASESCEISVRVCANRRMGPRDEHDSCREFGVGVARSASVDVERWAMGHGAVGSGSPRKKAAVRPGRSKRARAWAPVVIVASRTGPGSRTTT